VGRREFGRLVLTERESGIENERGEPIGSELIAQGFVRPEYFWPRPSAADYNASSAGGSNLSPTNPELRTRAQGILAKMGADSSHPLPADLATTSGSGLDPHITLAAAKFQAGRVAAARGISIAVVLELLEKNATHTGGVLTPEPVVNVLLVNLALNRMGK
jgi:K+-transporting ATPase ATPase C chain